VADRNLWFHWIKKALRFISQELALIGAQARDQPRWPATISLVALDKESFVSQKQERNNRGHVNLPELAPFPRSTQVADSNLRFHWIKKALRFISQELALIGAQARDQPRWPATISLVAQDKQKCVSQKQERNNRGHVNLPELAPFPRSTQVADRNLWFHWIKKALRFISQELALVGAQARDQPRWSATISLVALDKESFVSQKQERNNRENVIQVQLTLHAMLAIVL
jgi:hypothetical protein